MPTVSRASCNVSCDRNATKMTIQDFVSQEAKMINWAIVLCVLSFSAVSCSTAHAIETAGQGFRAAGGNAFWTVYDKYQEDCKALCSNDCKRRWRRLVAEHKRNNIPQVIDNTPACSK
jgi:predicted lipoprotein with Yx(FWY)xxD motif